MRLAIKSIGICTQPDLRRWIPAHPDCVAEEVMVDIGPKEKKSADTFRVRLATPRGLEQLEDRDGILAIRPLLVMRRYDFSQFHQWLQKTVADC